MKHSEVKWGMVLSYILIIINALYGFIITPYVLSSIGEAEYGVYKTISSLSSSLLVLDLGLGGTVMRYIAKYKSEGEKSKIESFISMAFSEGTILISIISLVCAVLYFLLPQIYAVGLSTDELNLAKKLFLLFSLSMVLHVVENLFNGVVSGFNKFAFANGAKLTRVLSRMFLIYILLQFIKSSVILITIDIVLTLVLLVVEYIYIRVKLDTKVRLTFKKWDKLVFGESLKYTLLLFLTSVVAQVNNNLDNIIVGAQLGATAVTVYSMGLLIFGMFENLSTAISGVMLPTVTNTLRQKDGLTKAQEIVVRAGRIQFLLLGAALAGFAVIGQDFIKLWLGEGFEDVYVITLILMVPALLELCVNVCLSVLRAKNMLFFRTMVIIGVTAINCITTIIGVYFFGYFAAAVSTAFSFVLGSVIIMNIYYCKKLSFNMLRIYKNIFSRIWICLIIASGALIASSTWIFNEGWFAFIGNVAVFAVVYGITLLLFGLRKDEKKAIPIINKFIR